MEDQHTIKENYTSRFLLYFAASCVAITFCYIFAITFINIPKENQRYADVCLGFLLGTLISTIISFYFGSSSSAKDKDAAYQKLIKDSMSQNGNTLLNKDNSTSTQTVETNSTVTSTSIEAEKPQ